MASPTPHVTRCLAAGIVALLPIGGAVFGVVMLEHTISESWRARVGFYFPGLGLLLALTLIYLIGLCVTTFLGRWLWRRIDRALEHMPLLGPVYQTFKEVLGYDTSRERFFESVVAVRVDDGFEIGLVTGHSKAPDGSPCSIVFVPGSPNPTNGRLVLVPPDQLQRLDLRAADALRGLVSMGKTNV